MKCPRYFNIENSFLKYRPKQPMKQHWKTCCSNLLICGNTQISGRVITHCIGLGYSCFWECTILSRLVSHQSGTKTVMIITAADDVMTLLDESQVTIGTIKGSRYVVPIKVCHSQSLNFSYPFNFSYSTI